MDLPTVSIRVGLPGAAPEEVESLITQQVEEVVNTVDGIDELRSISGQGTSIVIATFKLDHDLETAAQDIRDRVSGLDDGFLTMQLLLPYKSSITIAPPSSRSPLTADRSIRELTELADKTVRVQLERVGGVWRSSRRRRPRARHQHLDRLRPVGGLSNSDYNRAPGADTAKCRRAGWECGYGQGRAGAANPRTLRRSARVWMIW